MDGAVAPVAPTPPGGNSGAPLDNHRLFQLPQELQEMVFEQLTPYDLFRLRLASKAWRVYLRGRMVDAVLQSGPPVLYQQLARQSSWDITLVKDLATGHRGTLFTSEFEQSASRRDGKTIKLLRKYRSEPDAAVQGIIALDVGWRDKLHRLQIFCGSMSEAARAEVDWTACLMEVLQHHMLDDLGSRQREEFVVRLMSSGAFAVGCVRYRELRLDTFVNGLAGMLPRETDCQGVISVDGLLEEHPVGLLLGHLKDRKPRPDAAVVISMAKRIVEGHPQEDLALLARWSPYGSTAVISSMGNLLSYAIRAYGRMGQSRDARDKAAMASMLELINAIVSASPDQVHGWLEDYDMVNRVDQSTRHSRTPASQGYKTTSASCQLSPLMQAVDMDDAALVEVLVARPVNLDTEDRCGRTALMYCRSKHMVDLLLDSGVALGRTTRVGNVLHGLLYAAFEDEFDCHRSAWRLCPPSHRLGPAPRDRGRTAALISHAFDKAGSDVERRDLASKHNTAGITPLAIAIALGTCKISRSTAKIVNAIAKHADLDVAIRFQGSSAAIPPAVFDTLSARFPAWHSRRPLWIVFDRWTDELQLVGRHRSESHLQAVLRDSETLLALKQNGVNEGDREAAGQPSVRERAGEVLASWRGSRPRSEMRKAAKAAVLRTLG